MNFVILAEITRVLISP